MAMVWLRSFIGFVAVLAIGMLIIKSGYAPQHGSVSEYVLIYGGATVVWLLVHLVWPRLWRR